MIVIVFNKTYNFCIFIIIICTIVIVSYSLLEQNIYKITTTQNRSEFSSKNDSKPPTIDPYQLWQFSFIFTVNISGLLFKFEIWY